MSEIPDADFDCDQTVYFLGGRVPYVVEIIEVSQVQGTGKGPPVTTTHYTVKEKARTLRVLQHELFASPIQAKAAMLEPVMREFECLREYVLALEARVEKLEKGASDDQTANGDTHVDD